MDSETEREPRRPATTTPSRLRGGGHASTSFASFTPPGRSGHIIHRATPSFIKSMQDNDVILPAATARPEMSDDEEGEEEGGKAGPLFLNEPLLEEEDAGGVAVRISCYYSSSDPFYRSISVNQSDYCAFLMAGETSACLYVCVGGGQSSFVQVSHLTPHLAAQPHNKQGAPVIPPVEQAAGLSRIHHTPYTAVATVCLKILTI